MNLDELRYAVEVARLMIRVDAVTAAARMVHVHLRLLDPEQAPVLPVVVEAAALYTTVWPDQAWLRYLDRVRQHRHPADAPTGQPGTGDDPLQVDGLLAAGRPAGLELGHRSWSVDLDTATSLHRRGSCGEAVRTVTRALDGWQANPAPPHTARGLTLMVGLVAMLSACLRDTDAQTVLTAHTRRLPAPGHRDRHTFAIYALHAMDTAAHEHQQVCLSRINLTTAELPSISADRLPWPQRRGTWWPRLLGIPEDR